MDTRFWGPSGWRLLHLMTFAYNPRRDKKAMSEFLECLPFVLPCKFCRSSLIQYYKVLPFEDALDSERNLSRWMWKIHGQVNEKLRGQGQTIPPDPTYAQVRDIYTKRLGYGCSKTDFPGWEFLFSIVENHPLHQKDISTPIPGAPPISSIDAKDEKLLLEWNYLPAARRFEYVCRFWSLLPDVLPFSEWREAWKQYGDLKCETVWHSKKTALHHLWKLRCAIEDELQLINKTSFKELCNDLRLHRSGCAKSRNARTCRRIRPQRGTRRTRRFQKLD